MNFKIFKENRWSVNFQSNVETYYVWAGDECIGVMHSEEDANALFEKAKLSYVPNSRTIIREEEI